MLLEVHRYKFEEAESIGLLTQLSDSSFREILKNRGDDEWLFLRYRGGCEFFLSSDDLKSGVNFLSTMISKDLLPEKNTIKVDRLSGRDAVARVLNIAVGAAGSSDGRQLLELLQEAYVKAGERGHVGPVFHRLFQRGIWLHEKARQETDFFKFAVSPETVIVELAGKILGSISKAGIHSIGLHPLAGAIMKEFHQNGCRKFVFWGEPEVSQKPVVMQLGAAIRPLDKADELLEEADILIICPSETAPFSSASIQNAVKRRKKKPLLLFDYSGKLIADKKLKKINNLYLYGAEEIEKVIGFYKTERSESVKEMALWIQAEVDAFSEWQSSEDRYQFAGIIGATPQMQRIFEMISRIARSEITVLIDGESGTGKEVAAKAVHRLSDRADRPMQVINCGAIPENLLESELFGHERGAFTGAVAQKKGLFETADNGTIFLDEIGELPQQLQVKLLRFLQEGEIKRVGSNETIRLNVRVLAASNRDLAKMVEEDTFRSDLFYRLNVIQLTIPPLRERTADIALLSRFFIKRYSQKLNKEINDIAPEALQALTEYAWPGNIRELENTMERCVALAFGKTISFHDLPPNLQRESAPAAKSMSPRENEGRMTLKELEKNYILETLEACDWNYEQVCKELAIGRTTLWRKLKEYDLEN